MNDETNDKVDLFASGPSAGRTLHAHDEPPALSFQPGATFSPGAQSVSSTSDGADVKPDKPVGQTEPNSSSDQQSNKISNKLDDIIADTHDKPIKSSVRPVAQPTEQPASTTMTDVVKKPADKPVNSSSQVMATDPRDNLQKSYSSDRSATIEDMPVQSGTAADKITNKPAVVDQDKQPSKLQASSPAVKLNNVAVKDITKKSPNNLTGNHGFPGEDHLAGTAALGGNQSKSTPSTASKVTKKASKKGLKFALIAIGATLLVGIGGAMAYSPTRTKIVSIMTGKPASVATNTSTPSPSPTPTTEQKSDSDYSVTDYMNSLGPQGEGDDSDVIDMNSEASYASSPDTATAQIKLTTSNLPTTVAPSVVGSIFPSIPPSQVVNDFIGIESPCFETILPKENQPFYNDWCLFGATYGTQKTSNLQILPYTEADKATFDSVLAYFRSGADKNIKLDKETAITVGGVAAKKITFTGSQSAQSFPDVMVLVDFGKDRYKKDSLTARGFVIAGSYKDDFSKKSFDAALEHWSWK